MIIHFFSSVVVGAYQAMVTGCGFVNLGFVGLFWGMACSRILPAILCAVYFYSGKWRYRKLLME